MRERFQQWRQKLKNKKGWVMAAIATPIVLGMVGWLWLLPDRKLQPDHGRRAYDERATLTRSSHESIINGFGAIATVAGGAVLLLNVRLADHHAEAETVNLREANLCGADFQGADFRGANLCGADLCEANLTDADLREANVSGADLNGANLCGANLCGASLCGANLISANLSGTNLRGADLRYANLRGADLRYANLRGADLRYANLSEADLHCALISDANLCDANLSGALLFLINLREVLNLEPLQLEAKPSPFLCNVALPAYSIQPDVNPNRDCHCIPQLLSDRYGISLEEAQGIVHEARQHRWS